MDKNFGSLFNFNSPSGKYTLYMGSDIDKIADRENFVPSNTKTFKLSTLDGTNNYVKWAFFFHWRPIIQFTLTQTLFCDKGLF